MQIIDIDVKYISYSPCVNHVVDILCCYCCSFVIYIGPWQLQPKVAQI